MLTCQGKSKYIILLLIFLTAFACRLSYSYRAIQPPSGDASDYERLALNLAKGVGYVDLEGKPTSYRTPLYPLFLAIIYKFFGHNQLYVIFFQSLIGAVLCLFIYLIGKQIHSQTAGFFAAGGAALYFPFIYYNKFLLSENLFIFLLSVFIYLLLRLRECPSWYNRIFCGLFLGLASLTRPIIVLFLPLVLVFAFFSGTKALLKNLLISALFFILAILPWTIRNYCVYKAPFLMSTQGGYNFWIGNHPPKEGFGYSNWQEIERLSREHGIDGEWEGSKFLFRENIKFIINNQAKAIRLALVKLIWFWNPFDGQVYNFGSQYNILFGIVLSFSLFSVFLLKCFQKTVWLLYALVIYFSLTAMVFYGMPRFRLPLEPYLIILASATFLQIYKRLGLNAAIALAVIIISVNIFVFIFATPIKDILFIFSEKALGYSQLFR